MPKVLCTLRNASTLINGVRFASVPDGMMSENISDEAAAAFVAIKGYALVPVDPPKPVDPPSPAIEPVIDRKARKEVS